jgi:hypothetical protein
VRRAGRRGLSWSRTSTLSLGSPPQRCVTVTQRIPNPGSPTVDADRAALQAAGLFGRGFGQGELAVDDVEAAVPERGIGEVDTDDAAQLLG